MTISTGAGPLRWSERGARSAPPVLLLHGWGAALESWDQVALHLAQTHRVLCLELPGHGLSPDWPGRYDVVAAGHELAQALRAQGLRALTVVGHSLGGHLAIEIAHADPELVARLVLLSTPPALSYRRLPWVGRLSLLPGFGLIVRKTAPPFLVRQNLGFLMAAGHRAPEATVTSVRQLSWHSYRGWNAAIERYLRLRPAVAERVSLLGKPTLVLWGEGDRFWPANALQEFSGLANVETTVVDGAGHSVHLEAPVQTARLIARAARRTTPRDDLGLTEGRAGH